MDRIDIRELDMKRAQMLFNTLLEWTGGPDGVTRQAFSKEEETAFGILETRARVLGLQTERDAAGGLVMTLPGTDPDLPCIAVGSHLDSVRQGGNYDGAAGVVAALLILSSLKEQGFTPRRSIRGYAIRGEESSRFGKAYMGSSAMFGKLSPKDLALKDATGESMGECMRAVGIDTDKVARGEKLVDPADFAVWLELHIEQGPVLVAGNNASAVVSGIRGNYRHGKIAITGEAGHSGAVPGWLRHDAVMAAAELITSLDGHWQEFLGRNKDLVLTFGIIGTDPKEHAISRIPGYVELAMDIRSQDMETLDAFYVLFKQECERISLKRGVIFSPDRKIVSNPAVLDPVWTDKLRKAATRLGIKDTVIPSGAGHDAAVFANAGIPSAMVFVRNEHGSHTPRESMNMDDFLTGVALLREAILEAANE